MKTASKKQRPAIFFLIALLLALCVLVVPRHQPNGQSPTENSTKEVKEPESRLTIPAQQKVSRSVPGKTHIGESEPVNSKPFAKQLKEKIEKEAFTDKRLNREIQVAKGEVLVRFKKDFTEREIQMEIANLGVTVFQKEERLGIHRLKLPRGISIAESVRQLETNKSIQAVEPNYIASTLGSLAIAPNDPLYPSQWGLAKIRAEKAWELITSGPEVVVAILDTGVETTHRDLANRIAEGYDFVNGDNDAGDDHGHGTHVAGIIAAEGNNAIGVVGVAPNCRIMPVKVMNAAGEGTYSDVVDGLLFAADKGARVINMSIGGYAYSQILADAVDYAYAKDAMIVAAAGNDGTADPIYPAALPTVIAVSATDSTDAIWPLSNYGNHIKLCAPGVHILSTALNDDYGTESGTSESAAFVSGAAALLLSIADESSKIRAEAALRYTTADLGKPGVDEVFGVGRVDALRAAKFSRKRIHDRALIALRVSPEEIKIGEPVRATLTVQNRGTLAESDIRVAAFSDNQLIGSSKIPRLEIAETIEVTFEWVASFSGHYTNLTIRGEVEVHSNELNISNNRKGILLAYDVQAKLLVLYKTVPPVHQWITFQAYNKLPASPLKTELQNYVPTSSSSSFYSTSFAAPSGWKTSYHDYDTSSPTTALIEGIWEEDEITRPMNHFWDPDGGYNDGILAYNSALTTAVDRFNAAIANYSSSKARAYYWLGRVAHLLEDMSVPAHVHNDQHLDLGVFFGDNPENYEYYTAYVPASGTPIYKGYTSSSPNTAIPDISTLSGYWDSSTPSSYPVELVKLFYNLAEFTDDHDSDDVNGETDSGKYNHFTSRVELSFKVGNVSSVRWYKQTGNGDTSSGTLQVLSTDSGYELDRGDVGLLWAEVTKPAIYLYPNIVSAFDEKTTSLETVYDILQVNYTDENGTLRTQNFDALNDVLIGTDYSIVPSGVLDRRATINRAIGYVAALYQLFWNRTHVSIAANSAPSAGGTTSGSGVKERGSSVTVTASPTTCYDFVNWTESGVQVSTSLSYPFIADRDRALVANFRIKTFNITASAGANGSIAPSGSLNEECGTSQTFTASPNANYLVDTWYVNGAAVQVGINSYTLSDIQGNQSVQVTFKPNTVAVTVEANPTGRAFTVDGVMYSSRQIFNWISGSQHTIATTSPQSGSAGVQYAWSSWSDGGAMSHMVSPTSATTYTANFFTQYYLTMNAGPGGSVSPSSGWINSGNSVTITATPDDGYSLERWSGTGEGSFSGPFILAFVVMIGPITQTASFTRDLIPVTVRPEPDGRSFSVDGIAYSSSQMFSWTPGSSHTIATSSIQDGGPGTQYLWSSWSDSGGLSHTVSPMTATTFTADFLTQYYLTMNAGVGGNVSPSSGWRNSGEIVPIDATANEGYSFSAWAGTGGGAYTGSSNSVSIAVNNPLTEMASFIASPPEYIYSTNNGSITIMQYNGNGGAVTIPTTLDGLTVTSIGANAFYFLDRLTSVTIPNGVTTIGDFAFYNCSNLTNAWLPDSVSNIGNQSFSGSGLYEIVVPRGVNSIGPFAFASCTNLSAIAVDPLNSVYSDAAGVLYSKNQTALILCPAGKSGDYTILSTVDYIEVGAFRGCPKLTRITIPESVSFIGLGAFNTCASLTDIIVVVLNPSFTSVAGVLFDKKHATLIQYPGGKTGTYSIPDGVARIEDSAFAGSGVISVTIPDTVTEIGRRAFITCRRLTSITIPDSVSSIGSSAFAACSGLLAAKIGIGVTSIGNLTFFACTSLTTITIPEGITSIGTWAFLGCTNLTGVNFRGNAPSLASSVFDGDINATIYYLPGRSGWSSTFGGRPTVLWDAQINASGIRLGTQGNEYGLTVTGASGLSIVVEASTNLVNLWTPLQTNTLTGEPFDFVDFEWTNYPFRFYRVRWP